MFNLVAIWATFFPLMPWEKIVAHFRLRHRTREVILRRRVSTWKTAFGCIWKRKRFPSASFGFFSFLTVSKFTCATVGGPYGFWLDLGAADVAIAMETREATAWVDVQHALRCPWKGMWFLYKLASPPGGWSTIGIRPPGTRATLACWERRTTARAIVSTPAQLAEGRRRGFWVGHCTPRDARRIGRTYSRNRALGQRGGRLFRAVQASPR